MTLNNQKNTDGVSARQYVKQALLPEGLRDRLAPYAEQEADLIRQLMTVFASFGYDRVSPPLVEFEDSLLVGPGEKHGKQMFRLMDPESQKVMGLRADMTTQISRIAATRLNSSGRPLRLAYAGNVLRVKGSQIRPTRQFFQAGVELIGADTQQAEVEVITLAVESLSGLGIADLSLDLTIAPFLPQLCADLDLDEDLSEQARQALDTKDVGGLAHFGETAREQLKAVLLSAGPAAEALADLRALDLGPVTRAYVDQLSELVSKIKKVLPDLAVTVDAGESHGFEYKTGIGFAIFGRGVQGELGRGGRYQISHADGTMESATGFSVYMDSLMRAVPEATPIEKLYVPLDVDADIIRKFRSEGRRVIQGLTQGGDCLKEAQEIGCSHYYDGSAIRLVEV